MSSPNRKRSKITLETKKKIIDVSANQNSTELGKQFELPPSTIRRILQNKRSILNALEQGNEAKRIVLRPVKHVNIDEAVASLGKSMELANQLGIENFKASDGWLDKFKHRHSIVFKSIQGEAGSIDIGELNNWQKEVLQAEISNFSPNDVFNIDETGLFWKLLPNKTLCFKGERCTSGKKSKERITVLVGANMSGIEKLPLFGGPHKFSPHK
uniref:HTH CENPB-type domain-containing protein n=1 Tax=Meloidogyne hapla TaxID=6305 RepID=A0A1I8BXC5_MELHA